MAHAILRRVLDDIQTLHAEDTKSALLCSSKQPTTPPSDWSYGT